MYNKRYTRTPFRVGNGMILSMEEEAVVVDTINTDLASIEDSENIIDRAEGTVQAVEDIVLISTDTPIEESTAKLMASVSDMSVAGTDMEANDLIPLIEHAPVVELSTESIEGIKNTAIKIWETIKEMIKRIWANVVAVWKNYSLLYQSFEAKLKKLSTQVKTAIDQRQKLVKDGSVVSVPNTIREHKLAKNVQDIADGLEAVLTVARDTIGSPGGAQNSVNLGASICKLLDRASECVDAKDVTALPLAVNAFIASVKNDAGKQINRNKIHMNGSSKSSVFDFGPSLPGGKQYIIEIPEPNDNEKYGTGPIKRFLETKVQCITDPSYHKEADKAAEIPTPKLEDLLHIVERSNALVNHALYYISVMSRKIETQRKTMETASTRLTQRVAAYKPDLTPPDPSKDPVEGEATYLERFNFEHDLRTLLRLNSHYATSTGAISSGILGVIRQQVSTMEGFVSKSLNQYSAKKA
jgi:hypothetical protein